jgi:hypothetical protein
MKKKGDYTKREYFLYIANKRIIRAVAMINSFKNFYSKHNKRNYEFSEKDMLKLDIKLTSALEEWRESYQEYFKDREFKEARIYAGKLSKELGVKKTDTIPVSLNSIILDWVVKNKGDINE